LASSDIKYPKQMRYGLRNVSPETLIPYIDWTYLLHAWKITGKYPAIFDDPVKGPEARKLT
jgi:5-methyltetrahydrofolate--homocysteine methyltransferase